MSIDWSRRQNSIGEHSHLPSQIIDPDTAAPGAAQTVRLLGPFNVTAAELLAGETIAPGKKLDLAAIAAGVIVVRAWIQLVDGWTSGTNPARVTVGVDTDADGTDMVDAVTYEAASEVLGAGVAESEPSSATIVTRVVQRTVAGSLYAYAQDPGAGEFNVYALIAEPSA